VTISLRDLTKRPAMADGSASVAARKWTVLRDLPLASMVLIAGA
jgi:hypothetical protein